MVRAASVAILMAVPIALCNPIQPISSHLDGESASSQASPTSSFIISTSPTKRTHVDHTSISTLPTSPTAPAVYPAQQTLSVQIEEPTSSKLEKDSSYRQGAVDPVISVAVQEPTSKNQQTGSGNDVDAEQPGFSAKIERASPKPEKWTHIERATDSRQWGDGNADSQNDFSPADAELFPKRDQVAHELSDAGFVAAEEQARSKYSRHNRIVKPRNKKLQRSLEVRSSNLITRALPKLPISIWTALYKGYHVEMVCWQTETLLQELKLHYHRFGRTPIAKIRPVRPYNSLWHSAPDPEHVVYARAEQYYSNLRLKCEQCQCLEDAVTGLATHIGVNPRAGSQCDDADIVHMCKNWFHCWCRVQQQYEAEFEKEISSNDPKGGNGNDKSEGPGNSGPSEPKYGGGSNNPWRMFMTGTGKGGYESTDTPNGRSRVAGVKEPYYLEGPDKLSGNWLARSAFSIAPLLIWEASKGALSKRSTQTGEVSKREENIWHPQSKIKPGDTIDQRPTSPDDVRAANDEPPTCAKCNEENDAVTANA
ncbi:hypothetical protein Dda_3935 [Drechslerella dactyloides]|uniref:Uncharacterized protein n=1 Tax=Drechslerella dactyloides TaxID=74499 RepID=A0AAD6NIY9_DREDA|nr:hypothetical protein Dda_3935 [Drechslerella dactyloides]